MADDPRSGEIGLDSSGGAARCFAHIGALQAIAEEGLRVSAIAANSSAAIIAALNIRSMTSRPISTFGTSRVSTTGSKSATARCGRRSRVASSPR